MSTARHALLLTLFAVVIYAEIFTLDAFSPEFPLFFLINDGLPFEGLLGAYKTFGAMWYRPTSFNLFYWIGQQFLNWHDLVRWKAFHFSTVLATCFTIYWFVLQLSPGNRLAAFLSAAFFISQPSLFAFVMDVAPFDFIHILLTVACVGFYVRAQRVPPKESILPSLLSWCLFAASLTAKEVCLAIPGYLLGVSVVFALLDRRKERLTRRLGREALRLIPFVALIPIFWNLHMVHVPKETFSSGGPYRSYLDFGMIGNNLRKFVLWIFRVYCFTGDAIGDRMYLSNWLNNSAGLAALAATAAAWVRLARKEQSYRLMLLLMAGWIAGFLIIPVYSGQYFWHVNLPLVGYCVIFGLGMAYWWNRLTHIRWRSAAAVLLFGCWALLGRDNMHVELHRGTHAFAFRINNRELLDSPPVPAAQIVRSSLIYIEDRAGMGQWWYGCYGNLFRFVYKRHDLREKVVPVADSVSDELWADWRSQPSAFFFRYDERYRWIDASREFRTGITMESTSADVRASHPRQFSASMRRGGTTAPVWSTEPALGKISPEGIYTAPVLASAGDASRIVIEPSAMSLGPGQSRRFAAVDSGRAGEINVVASHPEDADRKASVRVRIPGAAIEAGVRWSVEPQGLGSITPEGVYHAPASITKPTSVTLRATHPVNAAITATATIDIVPDAAIRIRAGGGAITDRSGNTWSADTGFSAGSTYTVNKAVTGTDVPALYQAERFHAGPFEYEFPVAAGKHRVQLRFAEIFFSDRGARIFNVRINGSAVLDRFDIVAEAGGPDRAVIKEFLVNSADGWITIRFEPVVSNPKISAIEITRVE